MRVSDLRAAWWARRALIRARAELRAGRLSELSVKEPPPLPRDAYRGVAAALRRVPHSCLERAVVLQGWHAAHGRRVDVIIGVTGSEDFLAHAWLEDEPVPPDPKFRELFRLCA